MNFRKGMKGYVKSPKIIYLGLADGLEFYTQIYKNKCDAAE